VVWAIFTWLAVSDVHQLLQSPVPILVMEVANMHYTDGVVIAGPQPMVLKDMRTTVSNNMKKCHYLLPT
jgi:hypothetical protein